MIKAQYVINNTSLVGNDRINVSLSSFQPQADPGTPPPPNQFGANINITLPLDEAKDYVAGDIFEMTLTKTSDSPSAGVGG